MAKLSQVPAFRSLTQLHAVLPVVKSMTRLLTWLCFAAMLAPSQTIPNNPQIAAPNDCGVSSAMFNGFFDGGTATVNGVANPANSVTFPNNTLLHNCDFYQWSEQMFLWLTSPAPPAYGGGGHIFKSPAFFTVSPADPVTGNRTLIANSADGILKLLNLRAAQVGVHGLPVIMSKSGQMFEVQPGPISKAGKPLVLNPAGKQVEVSKATLRNGRLTLLDNAGKAIPTPKLIVPKQIPREQFQRLLPQQPTLPKALAQNEEMVMKPNAAHVLALQRLQPRMVNPKLIAQRFTVNGRNIFLNLNGGVIDTEEGQADTGVLIAQNGSLIYYVTMVNDVMAYFLTGTKDGGITPTPTQFPTTPADLLKITTFASAHGRTFPDPNALAIEVKSSWIETTGIPNPGQYITTTAVVPTFDKTNPNKWTPNGQKTTTLALIGMHVVGSAKGHAEMIWSTFEHFGNSPDAIFRYNATTGTNPNTINQANPIAGTWLFCATGSTGPFNVMKAKYVEPNIVGFDKATGHTGITPIVPSDILRFKPFGAALDTKPNPLIPDYATSNTQIIGIDDSIQQDFAALTGGPDVRTNYFMTGATWTEGGAAPSGSFPTGIDVGTSQLANTTMETFQQNTTSFQTFGSNCFSCHGTNQLNVSHVACDPQHGCTAGIQPLF